MSSKGRVSVDTADATEEALNELVDVVKIGSYTYEPGRVLRMVDPIAFHEEELGLIDQKIRDGEWVEGEDGEIFEAMDDDETNEEE